MCGQSAAAFGASDTYRRLDVAENVVRRRELSEVMLTHLPEQFLQLRLLLSADLIRIRGTVQSIRDHHHTSFYGGNDGSYKMFAAASPKKTEHRFRVSEL